MHRWRLPLALGLAVAGMAILAVLAWGAVGGTRLKAVRGLVTAVEARDIGHVEAIMLRTSEGRELRVVFHETVDAHWTPGHMRDHMLFGDPVTVYYRRDGDTLVAYQVKD